MAEENNDDGMVYREKRTRHAFNLGRKRVMEYEAIADWTLLRRREKPIEIGRAHV